MGNPGEKYAATRHNIGWLILDSLLSKYSATPQKLKKLCLASEIKIAGKTAIAAKPLTFMNNSGEAVNYLAARYKIPFNNIVVISDEYNFPVGKVHLRRGGSDGGHNGVASVIEHLGNAFFLRLRCGIGKDFPTGGMVDYVLAPFPESDSEALNLMINKAVGALEHLVKAGAERAMSDINSGRLWQPEE